MEGRYREPKTAGHGPDAANVVPGWLGRSRGPTGLRPQYDFKPARRLVTVRERRLSRQDCQANGGDRPPAATVDKALAALRSGSSCSEVCGPLCVVLGQWG